VSIIVVVQVVVASMLTPSTAETEKLAKDLLATSSGKGAGEHGDDAKDGEHEGGGEKGEEHGNELEEVKLGSYKVTRFNPGTNTTLAIDFEVYGTVLASEAAEFEHRYEKSKARIREQITLTMHGTEAPDLTNAGLGLIKRQILEKTNRALGQPLLKEVLFSKFNFVER
ncbi:MAG: flagellar basal body-associated FliL family protein, partial [Pirellulales bacterium]|nr:flagellar basal body-associated FliL family protein [Pirellulales bacterium]